jgi:UDP-3-O-acyl-N-acetylglucosamine deacetylase
MNRTLAAPTSESAGIGLFSGKRVSWRVLPAAPGSGIAIRRVDLPESPVIPARLESLAPLPPGMPARNTNLAVSPTAIAMTVEHVLSALAGLGVTDALIELRGPELPIGDGSASLFVEAIVGAGLVGTGGAPDPIVVTQEIVVESGAGRIVARPRSAPGASYTYELDYGPRAPIPPQGATWEFIPPPRMPDSGPRTQDPGLHPPALAYITNVAPARTFSLQAEAEQMRAMGLFKEFTPKDLLVIGASGPIENAYRFDNEPARHKLLDLIGDLSLVGRPIQADLVATRAGHALNHAMARAVAQASK